MTDTQMLAMLRHAYHQLAGGMVSEKHMKEFANGLISPVIRSLESRCSGSLENRE